MSTRNTYLISKLSDAVLIGGNKVFELKQESNRDNSYFRFDEEFEYSTM